MNQNPLKIPDISARKGCAEKIVMLTAYDFLSAMIVDSAGVDMILVGDSLGMVVLGYSSTLPVTIEDIIHHTAPVVKGVSRAIVIADMPFMSYHSSTESAVINAGRIIKETGAQAVKLEGGKKRTEVISAIVDSEIPVMGHIGLTPQSVNRFGGYKVQAKRKAEADLLLEEAEAIQEAGVFSIVLEGIPRETAKYITQRLKVPTVGIGAGPDCDGQVLVFHDLLGYSLGKAPKFVRPYANLNKTITDAVMSFSADVRSGSFPSDAESYHTEIIKEEV